MKKNLYKLAIVLVTMIAAFSFNSCVSLQTTAPTKVVRYDYGYNNPAWAPTYYAGARYYYFPDIEVYYDLSTRNFIMLNTGRWLYVQTIAPFYAGFDLYNSYIVVLNTTVYQPWMHHHYYVKHYPRYYYIDYYDYSNIPYVRGYNENQKGAIYWAEPERYRARPWDDRNLRSNRQFSYSAEDRRVQQETTRRVNAERASVTGSSRTATADRTTTTSRSSATTTDRTSTTSRTATTDRTTGTRTSGTAATRESATTRTSTATTTPARGSTTAGRSSNIQSSTPTRDAEVRDRGSSTNYYGNTIGRPVRVEPQMRRTDSGSTSTATRSSTTTRSSATTTDTPTRSTSTSRTGGGR